MQKAQVKVSCTCKKAWPKDSHEGFGEVIQLQINILRYNDNNIIMVDVNIDNHRHMYM